MLAVIQNYKQINSEKAIFERNNSFVSNQWVIEKLYHDTEFSKSDRFDSDLTKKPHIDIFEFILRKLKNHICHIELRKSDFSFVKNGPRKIMRDSILVEIRSFMKRGVDLVMSHFYWNGQRMACYQAYTPFYIRTKWTVFYRDKGY